MLVKDQLNRILTIPTTPKRIVSLVPSQTELLIDLGLTSMVVGITKFCVHPNHLRKKIKVVGGTKTVHYHKIEGLQPDLIVCNKEENTLEMVQELEKICPVWVSDIYNLDDSLDMITRLGRLFGVADKASELGSVIVSEAQTFQEFMQDRPVKKVAYLIWKDPYMAAGLDTFIHSLLEVNKFQNIISEARYPEVKLSTLHQADVVLLSSEPYPFKLEDARDLEAKLGVPVKLVDGEYFSWYGSRLQKAFAYFRKLH